MAPQIKISPRVLSSSKYSIMLNVDLFDDAQEFNAGNLPAGFGPSGCVAREVLTSAGEVVVTTHYNQIVVFHNGSMNTERALEAVCRALRKLGFEPYIG